MYNNSLTVLSFFESIYITFVNTFLYAKLSMRSLELGLADLFCNAVPFLFIKVKLFQISNF